MNLRIDFNNLKKIEDSSINIGNLTVFTGQNNTGKSLVSKVIYSLFNSFDNKKIDLGLSPDIEDFLKVIKLIAQHRVSLNLIVDSIRKNVTNLSAINVFKNLDYLLYICTQISDDIAKIDLYSINKLIKDSYDQNITEILQIIATEEKDKNIEFINKWLNKTVNKLRDKLEISNIYNLISNGFASQIDNNLKGSFQINCCHELASNKLKPIKIKINEIGNIIIRNGKVKNEIRIENLQILNQFSKAIYLNSRVISGLSISPKVNNIKDRLSSFPQYVRDAYNIVIEQNKLNIKTMVDFDELIGGKIMLSDEKIIIKEKGNRKVGISQLSAGVAQIGVISLLLDLNLLENSIVFIEKPETSLHPEWQVALIKLIIKLIKNNCYIIMSTHSINIIKAISTHVKINPEDEKYFQFNHLSSTNKISIQYSLDQLITQVMLELTEPGYNLYMEELFCDID